ncbi:coagulase domain-containing protein [Staphylococcus aureus]|nr:coagulase domain-containing protein [Staphylococcus aureus]
MIDDLNSIIDDFFMETKQNRPKSITKYNPTTHNYKTNSDNKPNFDKLVEETKKQLKKQMILGKENCQKIRRN